VTLPLDPFRHATEPDEDALVRVVAGARARRALAVRRWPWVASASMLAAMLGGLAFARVALSPPTTPVDVDGPFTVARGPGFSGEGAGRWEGGTFTLDGGHVVTAPDGAFLIVTREATVAGRDADVRVLRDVFGTAVDVRSGVVTVACGAAPAAPVTGAELCLPVSAEGLLSRAAALGAGADALAALDGAVRLAGSDAVREEALFQRALARLAADPAGAVADLDAARVLQGGARHEDILRALARIHAGAGRCAAAAPLLDELAARGVLGPDAALVTACANSAAGSDRSAPMPPSP